MSDEHRGDGISLFEKLKDKDLSREGICIGEGQFVVERMIASKTIAMISVLCTSGLAGHYTKLSAGTFDVIQASEREISEIAGFRFHRGVMGAARRPARLSLSEFFIRNPTASRIIVCTLISELSNLGSIIRSGRAFGFDALVLGPGSVDPFNRKAVRVSMAGCFYLPVIESSFVNTTRALKERGFSLVAAVPDASAVPIGTFAENFRDLSNNYAIVFGHEGRGLDRGHKGACDTAVCIPIDPAADSINVGVAAGIFFHYFGKYR